MWLYFLFWQGPVVQRQSPASQREPWTRSQPTALPIPGAREHGNKLIVHHSLDLEWLDYSCRNSHPHFVKILGFKENNVRFVFFLKKMGLNVLLITDTVQSTKIALLCINNWLLKVDYNGDDDRCSCWENLHGQCLIKELEILQSLWKCVNIRLYLLLSPNTDKGMD